MLVFLQSIFFSLCMVPIMFAVILGLIYIVGSVFAFIADFSFVAQPVSKNSF